MAYKKDLANEKMKLVLGTMEWGRNGLNQKLAESILDEFISSGNVELDSAFMYTEGKSETMIGKANRGNIIFVATKANPWNSLGLQPCSVRAQLNTSLGRLGRPFVEIFYLHAPDIKTAIEDTLQAVYGLHQEGKFKEFGLSNFPAWQVMQIYSVCKSNGWVLPTVYQGMYNAITRDIEYELLPCLRALNIRFYAYNPLAGGILTGRYKYSDKHARPIGRFFSGGCSEIYRKRFWRPEIFAALENIQIALDETYKNSDHGIVSSGHASLRWLEHHSKLSAQYGDTIILGASKLAHVVDNIAGTRGGPLAECIVRAFDEAWLIVKPTCVPYFR